MLFCLLDVLRSSKVIGWTLICPDLGKFSNKGFVFTTNLKVSRSTSLRRKGVEFGYFEDSRSDVSVSMDVF
jgi:hypothetical protein